jgi:hypothetical protein
MSGTLLEPIEAEILYNVSVAYRNEMCEASKTTCPCPIESKEQVIDDKIKRVLRTIKK